MSPFSVLKTTAAALFGVGLLAFGSLASAAIYRQVIDPPIYFGVGLFDVDAACIPTLSGIQFTTPDTGSGGCGTVDIIDLLLQGNNPPSGTILFAGPQPTNVITDAVTGLLWFDQTLVGIDTNQLSGAGTGDFSNLGGYSLQYFAGPHVAPGDISFNPTAGLSCQSSDFTTFDVITDDPGQCLALAAGGGVATQEAATLVPEPGILTLLVGALGAGWITRRKVRSTTQS